MAHHSYKAEQAEGFDYPGLPWVALHAFALITAAFYFPFPLALVPWAVYTGTVIARNRAGAAGVRAKVSQVLRRASWPVIGGAVGLAAVLGLLGIQTWLLSVPLVAAVVWTLASQGAVIAKSASADRAAADRIFADAAQILHVREEVLERHLGWDASGFSISRPPAVALSTVRGDRAGVEARLLATRPDLEIGRVDEQIITFVPVRPETLKQRENLERSGGLVSSETAIEDVEVDSLVLTEGDLR